MKTSMQACDICDNASSVICCEICKKNQVLCAECYKRSHNSESRRQHTVHMIADPSKTFTSFDEAMLCLLPEENCAKHPRRGMEYVCKTCGVAICCDCLLVGDHKGHDATSFEEGWAEVIKTAPAMEKKMQQDYGTAKKALEEVLGTKREIEKRY
eukprot:TRINITY_DN889_c0_g1_i2.p3 TRINITY_DN889_c0_g1~~TRINITY_DN889_c0_g1_i2.p3  ORF type:complete len:155 (+),score=12.52 TRINITY_DN889_c0_g1_i2:266-730(+)